jgi:tRNA nucleotidyltransferase (CCA-adding enzyme)
VLHHLFPEIAGDNFNFDQENPHHKYTLGEHSLHVLQNMADQTTDPDARLAALYHDVGKPASAWRDPERGTLHYYRGDQGQGADHELVGAQMVHDRMRALNYPVARINRVQDLVKFHMFPPFVTPKGARKFLQKVGPHADDLLNLRQADSFSKGRTEEEQAARTSADQMRELVDQARKQQAPTDISNLSVNGNDLLQMGLKPGPQIGQVLRQLVDHVVSTPMDNQRDKLLSIAQGYVNAAPSQ